MQFNNDCGIIKLKASGSVNAHGDIGAEPAGHLQYALLIFPNTSGGVNVYIKVRLNYYWQSECSVRDTELNGNMIALPKLKTTMLRWWNKPWYYHGHLIWYFVLNHCHIIGTLIHLIEYHYTTMVHNQKYETINQLHLSTNAVKLQFRMEPWLFKSSTFYTLHSVPQRAK